MSLTRTQEGYFMVDAQGSRIAFPDPEGTVEKGGVIRNFGCYHEIRKRGFDYVVTRWMAETIDVESYVFRGVVKGKAWPLLAIEDTAGHGLDLVYDANGLLLGIKQKLEGLAVRAETNAAGLITGLFLTGTAGARERIMSYGYDRQGRLISASDALGQANRYEYDAKGLMVRELSKDGAVFSFKYDEAGRCARVSGLGNYDAKILRYMEHVGFTEVTDSTGAVMRYQYHPSGQVYMQMDPLGG
jgi:YD repeat-containing protein